MHHRPAVGYEQNPLGRLLDGPRECKFTHLAWLYKSNLHLASVIVNRAKGAVRNINNDNGGYILTKIYPIPKPTNWI